MTIQETQLERTLALPKETWQEIDERAKARGIKSDAVIREALHLYFDLVGAPFSSRQPPRRTLISQ
jgi:hypothetical protein